MKTVNDIGGPTDIARICGLKPPTVHGWKAIPERHCPSIESAKSGDVTCEEMRPDVAWHRVKDKKWPHPDGRPLVDYARMANGQTSYVARPYAASNDGSVVIPIQKPI